MNLYVGNLAWKVTEQDLENLFSHFGEVKSAVIIKENRTNRSKGFGFVEMINEEEGKAALQELNGTLLEDRELVINEAKPKEQTG